MHARPLTVATAVATLLLLVLCQRSTHAQVCPSGRSLSTRQFGFAKSAAQGVNESYAYLVFVLDVTGPGAGPLDCSGTGSLLSMQRVEAGLWAIASMRSRYGSLLPGVTVGALLLDGCQSSLLPAQLLANLQSCETAFGDASGGSVDPRNTAAFIGVDSMPQASDAFALTNWTGRPAVSCELTSSSLSRTAHPLLARVAPSDLTELDALGQALRSLGVAHVQVVHSAASVQAGRLSALADSAETRLAASGVCVANRVAFSPAAAASVAAFPRLRPVLLLMTPDDLAAFSGQMLALMPSSGVFTWLFTSELWGSVAQLLGGRENFFSGALAFAPSAASVAYPDFLNHFRSVRPDTVGHAAQNPWLAAAWSSGFRCNLPGSSSTAYPDTCSYAAAAQNLQATATVDPSAARVIQSVDLTLHGLELARRALCGVATVGLCDAFRSDANRFRLAYSSLFSAGSLGYTDVALDPATGAASKYTLLVQNYQKRYPGNAWTQVGVYQSGSLSVTARAHAYGVDERNASWASSGACDSACLTRCPSNATTISSTAAASPTATTSQASATTGDLSATRIRRQYWVYALIVCASVGIIVTLLFMVYILFKVLGLPSELKSFNTLWSGQFLLFAILIGYVFLFAWTPGPSIQSCGIIRFVLGFEYAAVFALLMVKLLNLMNDQLRPVYQVLMFALALGIQVAINVEWLILVPIQTVVAIDGAVRCGQTFEQHLQSLVYCMVLILLCTCLAIRAHSIGRNNREAIFVGCTAGLSIPVWIAWGLVGSLNQDLEVKDASLAFGLFVSLTLVLLIIFLPKIQQLRRLEDGDIKEVVVVDAIGDDVYDLDEDPYGKDQIYQITQVDPNDITEAGGGDQFYLASPDILAAPMGLGLPYYARGGAGGARSLQGDPASAANGGGPRSVVLGVRTPRRAYSDYSPSGEQPRPSSAPGSHRARPPPPTPPLPAAGAAKETKAQRLAKLGFL